MNLTDLAKRASRLITDNSPTILTALATTGVVTTAFLASRASFKAALRLEQDRVRRLEHDMTQQYRSDQVGDATPREKAGLVWKLYIPAGASAVLTIAAIVGANQIGNRRTAAMAAGLAISERAFEEYRDRVVEKIGETKERGARDAVAQARIDATPSTSSHIVLTDKSVLCYEAYTGRYFMSDMETLRQAQNTINHQVIHDSCASLSDFYDQIGLPHTKLSDDFGWNLDKLLELDFSTTMSDKQQPCIFVDFKVSPIRGYSRLQ